MTFRNHEHFSDITKDKSCAFVSVGQNVDSCMEAVHEALWKGGIYPSDVFGFQVLVESFGVKWYFYSEREYCVVVNGFIK